MAAEGGKIDPMHQFEVQTIWDGFNLGGHQIQFTNSSLWMCVAVVALWLFMLMGMKRELIPGRGQMMVEGAVKFVDNLLAANVGKEGKKYVPYIFSLFMFILFSNVLGLVPLPLTIVGIHPFTATSHFTVTGVLAIISFLIVLLVGFWKHKLHFFSLFIPHGTPLVMVPLIFCIELVSFLVRPFSLGLRLFVAMMAGHVLLEVLSSFVIDGINAGFGIGPVVSILSFVLMIGISGLELLVAAIQAYVFALLTSVYLNDAVNLH